MANAIHDVIDEIIDAMRRTEQPYITMSWKKFYELNGISRFKQDRRELLWDRATTKGIILGFGDNAVVACRDRDFSPAQWDS